MPIDPKAGAQYEYSVKSATSFELCATFASDRAINMQSRNMQTGPSTPQPAAFYGKEMADNWDHKAGRVCFDRTIDPDRYPAINKPIIN